MFTFGRHRGWPDTCLVSLQEVHMKVPSSRTRQDMETAAELRASGATWETIGRQIDRQATLIMRWVRQYAQEWEQLLRDAEARASREGGNESRMALRLLLRHKSARIRLH